MKSINKIMLAAGILFQLSASLYADNWSDAFFVFGGGSDIAIAAQNVLNNKGKSGFRAVLNLAVNKLNSSNEGMAVAAWLSNMPSKQFVTSYSNDDVQAAGQAFIDAANRSVSMSGPVPSAPVADAAVSKGWFATLFGSESSSASSADVQAAQKADAAAAAANEQALQALVNSSATGANLYNGYVNLIMDSLQQAISGIADPVVQGQVMQNVQSKMSGMQAAVRANNSNSRVLGKISSKKNKKSRK